jgi:hypothetical protein
MKLLQRHSSVGWSSSSVNSLILWCMTVLFATPLIAGTSGVNHQTNTISHSHNVGPGYSDTTTENIPDKNQNWSIEVDISWSGGTLQNEGFTGDFSGSFSGGFSKLYTAGDSTTGYYGHFYGEIIPESMGGGGEGPPPDYRFDAYAKGGVDSFTVTPDQARIPVPASSTDSTTFTATTNAKWIWAQTMPGSFSANDTSGSNDTYDAYCTHAGSYTLQAEKHDDKITALATYIPTGVQRLYAKQTNNASNWEEVEQTLPIQGGTTNSEVPVLCVPYTEDENGQSTTSVTLKAFAYPTSDFPEDSTIPDWSTEIDEQTYPQLAWDGQEEVTALQMEPGTHTISVECGNALKVEVIVIYVDLDVDTDRNNTLNDDDDENEDYWELSRGAFLPPIFGSPIDPIPDISLLAPVVINQPTFDQPEGWHLRLRFADSASATDLRLYSANGVMQEFDQDGNLVLEQWPTATATYYAAALRSRKYADNAPDLMKLNLEVLDASNKVRCADSVSLKTAPLILPPEYITPSQVYSSIISGVSGINFLETTAGLFMRDYVKFCNTQTDISGNGVIGLMLDSDQSGNLHGILRHSEDISSLILPVRGHGGNMMATPPLGNAPYGKIMIGSKRDASSQHWVRQGLQPVITINTDWLLVGHVDEIFLWASASKVIYANPLLAADLLHSSIVAGRGDTETIWFGFEDNASRVKTIEFIVIAPYDDGYKQTTLSSAMADSIEDITITVNDSVFSEGDILRVDDEFLQVEAVDQNFVTVSRAQGGRPATAHQNGAIIYALSDVMCRNLPVGVNADQSAMSKIGEAMSVLRAGLGSYADEVTFKPMPVLFDKDPDGTEKYLAATSNVVNSVKLPNGKFMYPWVGHASFDGYVQKNLNIGTTEDVWALHCYHGEIHCATASVRPVSDDPAWWQQVQNNQNLNWE